MTFTKTLSILGLVLAVGAGAAVGAATLDNPQPIEAKAGAAKTIYLDNSQIASGSDTAVYFMEMWNSANESGTKQVVKMTLALNSNYEATLAADMDKITFYRNAPGTESVKRDGESGFWNKAATDAPSGDKNTFKLNSDCVTGGWEKRSATATGYAVIGTIRGVTDWENGAVLEAGEELVKINDQKIYATLHLHANDEFMFAYFYRGYITTHFNIKSHESSDSKYYEVTTSYNHFKVFRAGVYYVDCGWGSGSNDDQWWWYYANNSATAFARRFLSDIHCTQGGGVEPTYAEGEDWNFFKDWYTYNLDGDAKDTFFEATPDASGTDIEQALSKYLSIVGNYHYYDYMTDSENHSVSARNGIANISIFNYGNSSNQDSAWIIVLAGASLLVAASFIYLRKRKEQ